MKTMNNQEKNSMARNILRLALLPVLLLTLLASACGSAQPATDQSPFIIKTPQVSTATAHPAAKYTVALVMKTLTNPFFVEMEKGARMAETELGIKLVVKTAAQETSIQQQIEIVDELVKAKVDAIVIAPGDSKELIPSLKKAQDAGIKVVNIDNRLDEALSKQLGLTGVPYISVDNNKGAYLSAKFISDQITTPTKVLVLEGIREARNAQDRRDGAMKAFAENTNITVVASETAHWKIDEAHDVTASAFQANPDIGAIFCANDMMALGAIQYLNENSLSKVLVAGYDNLAEAQQAVRDGKLQSTINQQAALQGYTGVAYALKMVQGVSVPTETYVDVILVTKATLK
jgi:ribose transport system substrate-binding protein